MTYQLAKVALKNFQRIVSDTAPMYVDLSPITGNDASFLRVAVTVDNVAGIGSGDLALEHSPDGGVTWIAVTGVITTAITIAGTYTIETAPVSGILSPNVRLLLTADAGFAYSVLNLYKTYSDGPIIPTAAVGGATEATLLDIYDAVDGLEGMVDGIEGLITAGNALLTDMKALSTTLNGYVDQIEGYTDGIEGLVTATNAALTTLDGHVDDLETLVTGSNTKLDTLHTDMGTIAGYVDGLETLVGTTNSTLTTIDGHIDDLETLVTSSNTKLDTLHTDMGTIAGYVDGLETLVGSTNHRLDSIINALAAPVAVERTVANAAVVRDYSTANISDAAWTEIIAVTSAKVRQLKIFDSSGAVIRVATGAGGAEADLIRITPGGDTFEVVVAAGTRISLRAETGVGTISVGTLVFQMFT